MRDRPIIFSGPMVRALLAGQKTQTRRLAKFVAAEGAGWHIRNAGGGMFSADDADVGVHGPDYAPYAAGDRLYVRESIGRNISPIGPRVVYRADHGHAATVQSYNLRTGDCTLAVDRWTPSIHMPREFSRLTLLVDAVRVERLHEISEADAEAEGVRRIHGSDGPNFWTVDIGGGSLNAPTAAGAFKGLWQHLHGEQSWDENPWIVAITFRVEHGNIDSLAEAA